MKKITFFQRSRLGKVFYEKEGDRLHISGKIGFKKIDLYVTLSDIEPHFERSRWRSLPSITTPLVMAGFVSALTWYLRFLAEELYLLIAMSGAMFVCVLLFGALRGIAPIEVVRFRTKSGHHLFDVVKEKKQAEEFEQFIEDLCGSITSISNDRPPNQALQHNA